ncbi:MAG: DUF503 domain-containing protein [Actinobacteria bacterium]|nr:MAG: DUF503 domain-containing protein [Actinomycetota bacterium]
MRHPPRRFQRRQGGRRPRVLRDAAGRADGPLRGSDRSTRSDVVAQPEVLGTGFVGILSVELHFPESGSLKGKRKYVKSAKAQLQNRFGASVAEVAVRNARSCVSSTRRSATSTARSSSSCVPTATSSVSISLRGRPARPPRRPR